MSEPELSYPARRPRVEWLALGLVLLVLVALPLAILGYAYLLKPVLNGGSVRTIELTARVPTANEGGWTPETLRVQKGERVRLRLTSADVIHGFSIPKLGVDAGWVEPGKVKEVEFVAAEPGRYTFLCTVWCESGHWRMRGDLIVVDPADPASSERDVSPPATDWMAAKIDIDAPHVATAAPTARPNAARGLALWQQMSHRPLSALAGDLDLRRLAPSEVFARLGAADLAERPALAALTDGQRWDVVAALWYAGTTPAQLTAGARLYERDCTGCHGAEGRGDGPGAGAINEPGDDHQQHEMVTKVADFTDLARQAGAPDLLYYGKLVRGGMGTSMPYWGTLYREEELWAVIAHLRSFGFDFPFTTSPETLQGEG